MTRQTATTLLSCNSLPPKYKPLLDFQDMHHITAQCVTPIVTITHTVLFDPNFTCFIVLELLACYTDIPRKNTDLMYIETCEASVRIKQI